MTPPDAHREQPVRCPRSDRYCSFGRFILGYPGLFGVHAVVAGTAQCWCQIPQCWCPTVDLPVVGIPGGRVDQSNMTHYVG